MGRPKKWDQLNMPDKLDMVKGWCKQGSTDEEISEMLGISTTTYYEWKKQYPEFADAIKKGKPEANGEILNSAFKQTTGYYVTKQQAFKVKTKFPDPETGKIIEIEKIEIAEYQEFIQPNPTMTIFMLKNRLKEDYRDKQEVEHSGGIGVTIVDDVK